MPPTHARPGDVRPAPQDARAAFGVKDALRQGAHPTLPEKALVRDGQPQPPQRRIAQGGFGFPIGSTVSLSAPERALSERPIRATLGAGFRSNLSGATALAQRDRATPAGRLRIATPPPPQGESPGVTGATRIARGHIDRRAAEGPRNDILDALHVRAAKPPLRDATRPRLALHRFANPAVEGDA